MKIYAILASILLSGCGPHAGQQIDRYVTPVNNDVVVTKDFPDVQGTNQLTEFVRDFYDDAARLNHKLDHHVALVQFSADDPNLVDGVIGYCNMFYNNDGVEAYSRVTLLLSHWLDSTDQMNKTLVYHELGHCALDLQHTAPDSDTIMQPIILDDSISGPNWDDLVTAEFASSNI